MHAASLRRYQREFRDNALDAIAEGQSPLPAFSAATHAGSPTGSGKTRMVGATAEARSLEGATIVIAHRNTLVSQNARSIAETFGANVVVERAETTELQNSTSYDVCSTSVQTLMSRLEVLDDHRFATIVIDETHAAFSPSYQTVIQKLAETSPGAALIGVTATSYRTDGADFGKLFASQFFERDLLWAWREYWLKRAVQTRVEDEDLVTRYLRLYAPGGEIESETGRFVPTIIPAATVDEGRAVGQRIRDAGVEAYMVDSLEGGDGETSDILAAYNRREFPCLLAYSQILEGFDCPHASAILWGRRTESPVLFMQGNGRVFRPDPVAMDQDHGDGAWQHFNADSTTAERAELMRDQVAYIDEFVGDEPTTRVWSVGKAVGFHPYFDYEGTDVLETTERGRYVADTYGVSPSGFESASHIERVVERRHEFERARTPANVPDNAQLVWSENASGFVFVIEHPVTLKTGERAAPTTPVELKTWAFLRIYHTALGRWAVTIERPERYWMWYNDGEWNTRRHTKWTESNRPDGRWTGDGPDDRPRYMHDPGVKTTKLLESLTKGDAFYQAECYVYKHFPDQFDLKYADASWRSHSLSRGQERLINSIRKRRIPVPEGLTKGEASHLIDHYFAGLIEPWAPAGRRTAEALL